MFSYKPLLKLLIDCDMKLTDLGLSSATRAKINKNEYVAMDVLNRICNQLDCQPGDLLEYMPDKEEESTHATQV